MTDFIRKKYVKFQLGNEEIYSHIDAVHTYPPQSDKYTGEIVEDIVNEINCSAIIATVSRKYKDINRPRNEKNCEAIDEYRDTIRQILEHLNILEENDKISRPYLHIAIHGMKDKYNEDIEIGTRNGVTCSENVKEWVIEELKKSGTTVGIDKTFTGDISKSVHRLGDLSSNQNYLGYGENFNTIHLEFSLNLRQNHRKEIIKSLSDLILKFCDKFK